MSDTTEYAEAADHAAAWWAKALGAPKFDNGGDGTASVMASMILATTPAPQQTQYDVFREKLATTIAGKMHWGSVTLGVDYGPDVELADAAVAAGIPTGRFPWKTIMWIYPDYVIVGAGYQAAPRLVWSAPAWRRPICGDQQYSGAGDPLPWACGGLRYHDGPHAFDVASPLCAECDRPEAHVNHREDGYRSHAFSKLPGESERD